MNRSEKRKRFNDAVEAKKRVHKKSFIVYSVLRALVIVCMIRQFINRDYEAFAMCILTLLLLVVPSIMQVRLKVQMSQTMEIIILCFIFAAEILGEINRFYVLIPGWDTILHTLNGFVAAGVGYSLVDMMNRDERLTFSLSPAFVSIVAFCFSMTVGVMWEFIEFGADHPLAGDVVEMEAFALARVCLAESVTFACAKYVTDGLDAQSAKHWSGGLAAAASALESVFRSFVAEAASSR